MARKDLVGIGWDVGGWRGKKQGRAALLLAKTGAAATCGRPRTWSLTDAQDPCRLDDLIDLATGGRASRETHRVVIAVDAPFGFPRGLARLVSGKMAECSAGIPEVLNPYAYRDTDRLIEKRFKKPLSATFDKLGNNATVAMHHLALWKRQGLRVLPFDVDDGVSPIAMEVYPAIIRRSKTGPRPLWLQAVLRLHHPRTKPGSDEQDALVCAALALAYGAKGAAGMPVLQGPTEPIASTEGWIYYPVGSEWYRLHPS